MTVSTKIVRTKSIIFSFFNCHPVLRRLLHIHLLASFIVCGVIGFFDLYENGLSARGLTTFLFAPLIPPFALCLLAWLIVTHSSWNAFGYFVFFLIPYIIVLLPSAFIAYLTQSCTDSQISSRQARYFSLLNRGLCPHCGYDLRATPTRCPECGKSP